MLRRLKHVLMGAALAAAAAGPALAGSPPYSPTVFTSPQSVDPGGTIGFAYAGNKFVGSVQKDGKGALYSTDLTGGNVQVFAPNVSLASSDASEHFLASSFGIGGFAQGNIFAAAGNTVVQISNDGSSSSNLVTGLNGNVRGLAFDTTGLFNDDLLVTTDNGHVYEVNSLGVSTLIANLNGPNIEGLDVVPLGATGINGYDGKLIVDSENSGLLYAIDPAGIATPDSNFTVLNPNHPVGGAEELSYVPANLNNGGSLEGLYGANYSQNVVFFQASDFTNYIGDLVVTSEFGHGVFDVKPVDNGGSINDVTTTQIGSFPNQPEDGLFVTTNIIHLTNPVPEPAFFQMGGLMGLAALGYLRRRQA